MKTLVLLSAFAVGCASATPAPHFPRTYTNESQDAWLHAHCESRPLMETTAVDFDADMKKADANFAEMIAGDTRDFVAKPFRCSAKPTWYAADVIEMPADLF